MSRSAQCGARIRASEIDLSACGAVGGTIDDRDGAARFPSETPLILQALGCKLNGTVNIAQAELELRDLRTNKFARLPRIKSVILDFESFFDHLVFS